MRILFYPKALTALPARLLRVLSRIVLLTWLKEFLGMIRGNRDVRRRGKHLRDVRRGRPARCSPRCAVIRPDVYKRADPLIYSQKYLMEQGLAVTWDNPDIQLFFNGSPVSSSDLQVDTEYDVVATVYNNSLDGPAVGLPVHFSFQSFGVGAVLTPIGTTVVDLPVKGAPGHPVAAKQVWRTPATAGHYCLKVDLEWFDDANPKNNMGQENTNVGIAQSPAVFVFPVRNEDTIPKRIRMTVDTYTIPASLDCRKRPEKKESERQNPEKNRKNVFIPVTEEAANWTLARVRHDIAAFPVPAGWSVTIEPAQFSLAPGAAQQVTVRIDPPDAFRGEKAFNINALHGTDVLGGVTLTVRKNS